MTRRRQTIPPVPVGPLHRRTWRSFWRRCSCGLSAPCIDRLVPTVPFPFPPRGPAPLAVPSPPSPAIETERRYHHADENLRPGTTANSLSRCLPGGPHSPARRPQMPPGNSPKPARADQAHTIGGGRRHPNSTDGGRVTPPMTTIAGPSRRRRIRRPDNDAPPPPRLGGQASKTLSLPRPVRLTGPPEKTAALPCRPPTNADRTAIRAPLRTATTDRPAMAYRHVNLNHG